MKKFLFLFIAILLAGCGAAKYETVSVDEALKLVTKNEVKILDVRTPDEYNGGHIPGAELIPLQVLDGLAENLDKEEVYLIVCRSGNRSQQASDLLASKGFKVINMEGGMNAWTGEIDQ
ncbi:rhodanese-like domain-containing protein [Neobacillus piezotolerans]|uniref:Rhodanese-like domain-containing protein n=1 Tax=Neobacillus piezotolerans TaxID=2259171 RepID=A0A3D8GLJ4_9BACI|nr:rhodanese-like domain-containing protein [Neobacillus piezotolerans]RDU35147.1 rhodanese-like domain-containing protein [Neobacillus piezotolerans]